MQAYGDSVDAIMDGCGVEPPKASESAEGNAKSIIWRMMMVFNLMLDARLTVFAIPIRMIKLLDN